MEQPRADRPAPEARIIKRYANRKLYDTRDSRYVTLQQIAEYVREGEDVRIIDNKSKEDLTNVTLAQIIYEEEKKGEGDVRRSTLKSMIEEGRHRLVGSLPASLSKLLQREVSEDAEGAAEPEEPKKKPGPIEELRASADDRVKAVIGVAMGHVQQLQGEVKRLQGRIEELEARLASVLRRDPKEDAKVEPKDDPTA
ncbi:MAG: polyhydroxyalkanoate synthesis regulator DNA-binding domain-containing protein [Myxococcales bacterium]|nr:polyhydroxyalkanoate synthesis regulator DNA-binding domain-containing protein [Myxococcales bacterium]